MADEICDGFDRYNGTSAGNAGLYNKYIRYQTGGFTGQVNPSLGVGRNGTGQEVQLSRTSSSGFTNDMMLGRAIPPCTAITVGFNHRLPTLHNYFDMNDMRGEIFGFGNVLGSRMLTLCLTNAGRLFLTTHISSGAMPPVGGLISDPVIVQGVNHYIEIATDLTDSGDFEVRVDGFEVLSGTGVDLTRLTESCYTCGPVAGSVAGGFGITLNHFFDDMYIRPGVKSFWGPGRCDIIVPNADGLNLDLTPSVGSDHFAVVDELPINLSDSLVGSLAGDYDELELTTLPFDPTQIFMLQPFVVGERTDASSRQIRANLDSNGSISVGQTHALAETPIIFDHPVLLNPDGNVAWTKAAIDALKLQLEVVL